MLRQKINKFLELKQVEYTIIFFILLNLAVFILQTDVNINLMFGKVFNVIEIISVIVFTIEYFLRVICLEKFKDIFSPLLMIDLIAILPFYLSFITVNTIFLRILRLTRLLRLAKLGRYATAWQNIKDAFISRKDELTITLFIFLSAVLCSSILIYFAENQTGNSAFQSVLSSFWWSVVTMTTVGYGDVYPITTFGHIIASLTAIFGVGLHGLLIGVISSALFDIIQKRKEK